jgi:glycosyltransferase involved in cell wall biosynthesis
MTKNRKKIGIIARGLTKGGVTRVINNLLREFDSNKDHIFYLFTDEKDYLNKFKNIKVVHIKKTNKIFWDYFKIFPYFKKNKIDCMIYPKNIIPLTHLFFRFKKYNIVHDLGHFEKNLNAYKFWDNLYMKSLMGLSCKISDKILAVSEFTKNEIIKKLKIKNKKIIVISEAVEDNFKVIKDQKKLEKIKKKYKLKQPFIFYCGSISPRKNVLRMLKSFNKIKDEIPHNFYLTGRAEWGGVEFADYIEKNNLQKRVRKIGFVDEEDLPVLYNLADIFLFPSLYEGFGLPILEAQVCGCPVITSNISSMPEVAKNDNAILVDPYNEKEISQAILKIVKNRDFKEKIIKKGQENVANFSWEKTADRILNLKK